MRRSPRTCVAIAALAAFAACAAAARSAGTGTVPAPAGRVTGIGGVVVASSHPHALAAWYHRVLGIAIEPWGGAMFRFEAPGHPPYTVWSASTSGSSEFAHDRRDFMLNLAVDDLDALCSRLRTAGVPVYERQSTPYGKFASIVDPDGTKIELWQASTTR